MLCDKTVPLVRRIQFEFLCGEQISLLTCKMMLLGPINQALSINNLILGAYQQVGFGYYRIIKEN